MDADKTGVAFDDPAGVHRQTHADPADLACPGTPTDLRGEFDHLRQTGGAEGMAAPDEPTTRVHHQAGAVQPGEAGFCSWSRLPSPKNPSDSRA